MNGSAGLVAAGRVQQRLALVAGRAGALRAVASPPPAAAISPLHRPDHLAARPHRRVARVRIVARSKRREQAAALRPVQFFVDDVLLGEDTRRTAVRGRMDGREPVRAARDQSSGLGHAAATSPRDRSMLKPFEVVEASQVSSVLLEASVQDQDRPLHQRPAVARVPVSRKRRAADARPRHAGDDAGDLHAAGRQQPEHVAPDGLRAPGRGAR